MSNAMKAADDIKSLASKFRAVLEVASVLEKIGSLDQATRDAESRKNKAYDDEKKALLLCMDLDGKVALKQEAIKVAEEQADYIVVKAKQKAAEIFEEAQAKKVAESAKAAEAKAYADACVVAKKAELESVSKLIAEKQVELEAVTSQIDSVKSKLALFLK